MVTYDEYFRDVLNQILAAHEHISNLEDKPGDLETINKEIHKIVALFHIISNKIGGVKKPRESHQELAHIAEQYIETYSFEHEIAMMLPIYSQDTNRIRNIRYKILESFEQPKLVQKIKYILEDLK